MLSLGSAEHLTLILFGFQISVDGCAHAVRFSGARLSRNKL